MDTNILRLLQVLKDFVPELQSISDEELYRLYMLWYKSGKQDKFKDFILSNTQNDR